jgi:hypothetical protein
MKYLVEKLHVKGIETDKHPHHHHNEEEHHHHHDDEEC